MHVRFRTTIDDMVAVFLHAERTSPRFGAMIHAQLAMDGQDRRVVDTPNLTDAAENAYRRRLLASYRAYVFDELPAHVAWYRAWLRRDEVLRLRYIDDPYWNALSNHTRQPIVAAAVIQAGRTIFGQSNRVFYEAAEQLRAGAQFPELIVVGTAPDEPFTVYEGHVRLTAYGLAPACIPESLEVLAGLAPECARL